LLSLAVPFAREALFLAGRTARSGGGKSTE